MNVIKDGRFLSDYDWNRKTTAGFNGFLKAILKQIPCIAVTIDFQGLNRSRAEEALKSFNQKLNRMCLKGRYRHGKERLTMVYFFEKSYNDLLHCHGFIETSGTRETMLQNIRDAYAKLSHLDRYYMSEPHISGRDGADQGWISYITKRRTKDGFINESFAHGVSHWKRISCSESDRCRSPRTNHYHFLPVSIGFKPSDTDTTHPDSVQVDIQTTPNPSYPTLDAILAYSSPSCHFVEDRHEWSVILLPEYPAEKISASEARARRHQRRGAVMERERE